MIIYIVTASEGLYDDYYQWNVRGFMSEILAQEWIDTQPEINAKALQELEDLKNEYFHKLYELDTNGWGDLEWDKFENDRYTLEKKALGEIQTKYPNADLSISPDFHGYCIQALTVEGY